jgi:hypothetical protein
MKKKRKAAKAVNTALGLIVILAVILSSPLFGYGRGFASKAEREASAQMPASVQTTDLFPNAAATPRPTPKPTPTPVVLPSAPPLPDPTPEPTPQPAARPAAVQQNVQTNWNPDIYAQPEELYGEGDGDEGGEEASGGESYDMGTVGGQIIRTEDGSTMIENENVDLVIQTGVENTGETVYVENPVSEENIPGTSSETVEYGPISQEGSEGEAFAIE